MLANLIKFLLLMHPAKELMTSQVEMLKEVLRHNQEHFLVRVFSQASRCLQLVCGVEVRGGSQGAHLHHGPHRGPHL